MSALTNDPGDQIMDILEELEDALHEDYVVADPALDQIIRGVYGLVGGHRWVEAQALLETFPDAIERFPKSLLQWLLEELIELQTGAPA